MTSENETASIDPVGAGTRRGALAAMLAGSALGLGALGSMVSESADAKRKKKRKRKNGKARSSGNNRANGSLPSIQYVSEEFTADDTSVFTGFALCPSGYLPIGGGFVDAFPGAVLLSSIPVPGEREWLIEVDGAVDGDTMTVMAVCLRANDDSPEEEKKKRSRRKNGQGKKKR